MNNELRISNLLKDLGIPVHLHGFAYLKHAVKLTMENPELAHNICKGLYPLIALEFKVTAGSVERCIRHAIEVGIPRADEKIFNKVFRVSILKHEGKVTNAEFVATVVDYLQMEE